MTSDELAATSAPISTRGTIARELDRDRVVEGVGPEPYGAFVDDTDGEPG